MSVIRGQIKARKGTAQDTQLKEAMTQIRKALKEALRLAEKEGITLRVKVLLTQEDSGQPLALVRPTRLNS